MRGALMSHYAIPLAALTPFAADAAAQTGVPAGYYAAFFGGVSMLVAVVKAYRWVDVVIESKIDKRIALHEEKSAAQLETVHAEIRGLRDLFARRLDEGR